MKSNRLVILAAVYALATPVSLFAAKSSEASSPPFVNEFLGEVDFVEGRILALNEAMAAKESWRPAENVRSVSETYLHIAFGNYLLTKMAGFEPPADAGFSTDMKKWDAQTTEAAKINAVLKMSFDHVRSVAKKLTSEQLEKKMDLFGHEATTRTDLITLLNHMHEHLGQSIAYARMNGVVPPWTAAEKTPVKAKAEKAGN